MIKSCGCTLYADGTYEACGEHLQKLAALLARIDDAKESLLDAETARDNFLEPILVALGAKGGGVSHCSVNGDTVSITRTGSCRGSMWDRDYEFPLEIFTSPDPIKASAEYVKSQNEAKSEAERREKLATIQRLQAELGAEHG